MVRNAYISIIFLAIGCSLSWGLALPASEWNLATYMDAQASYSLGTVSVTNPGTDYWHVQLTRTGISLSNGQTYQATFTLKSVDRTRPVEVRIGRNGDQYDAFGEFGALSVTTTAKTWTKQFVMEKATTSDARFEFNVGKYLGDVIISDVQIVCLDCGASSSSSQVNTSSSSAGGGSGVFTISDLTQSRLLSADTVVFSDYTKTLGGNVFGGVFELGADTKIYGNVDVGKQCNLRERASVSGTLTSPSICTKQNGISLGADVRNSVTIDSTVVGAIVSGSQSVSVDIEASQTLTPGQYGSFYANRASKISFTAGTYTFASFYTEPEVQMNFDLSNGPITIQIVNGIRIGDRSVSTVTGGNPSEIEWRVSEGSIDLGTDGKFFGRFIAPNSGFRIASRTHLVGGVVARYFLMEPQSTLSMEPRAEEISHSEYNFGPFYNPNTFRYISVVPTTTSAIDMYVYATGLGVKVNGGDSRSIDLNANKQDVVVKLSRSLVDGFPLEAFSSQYVFGFKKQSSFQVFWNPQSTCSKDCDGSSVSKALKSFKDAVELASSQGLEIRMTGGHWSTGQDYSSSSIVIPVGMELVGNVEDLWSLTSIDDLPLIDLGTVRHLTFAGISPRRIEGFRIVNGYNNGDGGSLYSASKRLILSKLSFENSKSMNSGGCLHYIGDTLWGDQLRFNNCTADSLGGGLYVKGHSIIDNIIVDSNLAAFGAGLYLDGKSTIRNAVLFKNEVTQEGGAIFKTLSELEIWNATFFANRALNGYSGIGGSASGRIVNSIFWGNRAGTCSALRCTSDLPSGFQSSHSSFAKNYTGQGNYTGDPIFIDELNPRGANDFLGYDAGLTLDDNSPLINAGIDSTGISTNDLIGVEWAGNVSMGAYAWQSRSAQFEYGQWWFGSFKSATPARPLFKSLPTEDHVEFVAHGKHGRVIKTHVRKHEKTKVSKAVVRITLMDSTGTIYPDAKPIEVTFFRSGEENGKYVFMTLIQNPGAGVYNPDQHGRPIVFTQTASEQGVYKDAYVIHVKKETDRFYYEVIKW